VILDTGLITLLFTEGCPQQITEFFNTIKKTEVDAHVPGPVLTEAFKHLYIAKGKQFAQSCIVKVIDDYHVVIDEMNKSVLMKAGALKCQYRNDLSYVDCFLIALAIFNKYEINTTETFPKVAGVRIHKHDY